MARAEAALAVAPLTVMVARRLGRLLAGIHDHELADASHAAASVGTAVRLANVS